MIASIRGTLLHKSPTDIVVESNGIGYNISIPLSTYEALGAIDSPVTVLTHLHVREDALQLFGFATEDERALFRLLISVSGIGPRMGQTILSGISVADLRHHLVSGNLGALTTIPGIGKKLAERLIFELREKVERIAISPKAQYLAGESDGGSRSEAILALTSLGYSRPAAEKAVMQALREASDHTPTVEELIKSSLRLAAK
jgi:holliday junction DNA helicase RuvA